jgi:hypothetical protein
MSRDHPSRVIQLARYFQARPGEWIDGRQLEVAGRYAWRTRVSDLRRAPYSMTIENRLRRVQRDDGHTYLISEYRLVPEETIRASAAGNVDAPPLQF